MSRERPKIIRLVFYKRNPDSFPWYHKLGFTIAAFFSDWYIWPKKPYVHVEICMNDVEEGLPIAYGITEKEKKVHSISYKSYTNEYVCDPKVLVFSVSQEEYTRVHKFLVKETLVMDGSHGFDQNYWKYFIPVIGKCLPQDKKKWFCTKLTATALLQTRNERIMEKKMDPGQFTPQSLWDYLMPRGTPGLMSTVRFNPDSFDDNRQHFDELIMSEEE